MSQVIPALEGEIPNHVPPELAFDFRLDSLPGVETHSIQAAVDAFRERPDIFFGVGSVRYAVGSWMITRKDLILEAFQNPEIFSSVGSVRTSELFGENWPLLPIEADPPEHRKWRRLLDPLLAPGKVKAIQADIEALAVELIEGFRQNGQCEFVEDFAQVFPVRIFLRLFGLPEDDASKFVYWAHRMAHGTSLEMKREAGIAITRYLRDVIEDRRKKPETDLVSYVVTMDLDGRGVSDDEAIGLCMLLYQAGLDTVLSMLGYIFRHLAENPDQQQRLRDNPDQIPLALEEMLRAYGLVPVVRTIARDVEFHGVTMKKGDYVTLGLMRSGRDEQEYANPDVIDFDRDEVNAHITFGAGPHRCMGSHLARMELRIAIVEWLKRIPTFRITPGETCSTHALGVFGVSRLPLSW